MPATVIVRITDTLQYTPKAFAFPKKPTEDDLRQEIGDIIAMMKNPPKTLTFWSYGDATKNAINQIAHILQRITDQPRIKNLLLPPMLQQSQNYFFQQPEITSIPEPTLTVEPVFQPPRVKTQESSPTPPPIYQTSISSILDPIPLY